MESLSARSAWTIVGATVITWAFLLYGYSDSYPWLAPIEIVVGFFGLVIVATSWFHRSTDFPVSLGWIALGVGVAAFMVWCWIQVRVAPAYGTDESAFDQYAAQLVTHGHNPYVVSMAKSFNLFHVSPDGFTFRLNGAPVTQLSYPALSFLLYVPFLLLGMSTQLAIGLNVVAWAVAIVLGYSLLSAESKPLAVILGFFGVYTGFAVGGVTDALYVPFLVVAVYQWDRFASRQGWACWLSPAAMGLAMSIKQTPWFVLPFIVVGLYLETRRMSESVRNSLRVSWNYLWRVGLIFVIPNLAFIVANPLAWLKGILTPVFGNAVPAGQGWIALSNFLGFGGGSLTMYSVLALSVFLVSMTFFVILYPRTKTIAVILPSLVLFFSERSFANYLVMLLLPALVAATSVRAEVEEGHGTFKELWRTTARRVSVVGLLALTAVSLTAASLFRQPIFVQIESVTTTGQLATVVQATIVVKNNTTHSLKPVFSSESGGAITAPWNVLSGPPELLAGQSRQYVIEAPNFFAQPSLSGGFQIVALSESPQAMSVSSPYAPTVWHVNLTPEAVNKPVAVGVPMTLEAQVLNSTNSPVDQARIPVYLGQISYTQQGLVFTQAVINQGQIGETPVEGYTDTQGTATFTVTGTQASPNPVYFEANLIDSRASYPYGYSDIVPIRFVVQHD